MNTISESSFIDAECQWLREVVQQASLEFSQLPPAPEIVADGQWAAFAKEHQLNSAERLLIGLALCQFIVPDLLNPLLGTENAFRLMQCAKTGQLLPTGETFLKLVAGNSSSERIATLAYFATEHLFYQKGLYSLGEASEGLGSHFGALKISSNYRDLFLHNRHTRPRFSPDFPAHLVETALEWDDMVLNEGTAKRLFEVRSYLELEQTLRKDWGLDRQLSKGYRCLFHGPSGTGKTLAATLLGKLLTRDVYRVDLSTIVSKYVGETSKNLNALFNTAEDKNWILFFDEGDALFGKRIDSGQSNDKNTHFANQDTAFLLQRIENYNGLVIVASNFKQNMDAAFLRRFQTMITFEVNDVPGRLELWNRHLPKNCRLDAKINLAQIAQHHPFSAASIVGICNRIALKTLQKGSTAIEAAELEFCIREEQFK